MTGRLSKTFHGVGIGPLSKILAVKLLHCLTKNPCFFQLPTAEQWYTAATAVFDVIFTKLDEENSDDSIAGRVNQTLVNHVDIGARFSDARCAKALPMAFSAYKEGLQSHYLQEVHNAKVKCLFKVDVF